MQFILQDLVRSKEAIRKAEISDEWADAAASATHADEFKAAVLGMGTQQVAPTRGRAAAGQQGSNRFDFFKEASLCIEAAQPISDAIHQLEADRPLLSQVSGVDQRGCRY